MKRAFVSLAVALALAGSLAPSGAHAALGSQVGQYKLFANGDHLSLPLAAGVYDITVIGTYVQDNAANPVVRADAACSEASGRTNAWHDPIDTVVADTSTQGVVSSWHPYRYAVNGDYFTRGGPLSLTANPAAAPLTVYVNANTVQWVPTFPTAADGNGLGVGCNTTTHQYDTVVVSDGQTPTVLNIFDLNYSDNSDMFNQGAGDGPGLTVQVGRLAG